MVLDGRAVADGGELAPLGGGEDAVELRLGEASRFPLDGSQVQRRAWLHAAVVYTQACARAAGVIVPVDSAPMTDYPAIAVDVAWVVLADVAAAGGARCGRPGRLRRRSTSMIDTGRLFADLRALGFDAPTAIRAITYVLGVLYASSRERRT